MMQTSGQSEVVLGAEPPETVMVHPPQEDREPVDHGSMRTGPLWARRLAPAVQEAAEHTELWWGDGHSVGRLAMAA